jgi:hypothetical protein
MSNILERINPTDGNIVALLNAWADCLEIPSGQFVNDDLRFAAAEITRLTARLEELAACLAASADEYCSARCPSIWVTELHPEGQPHTDQCKRNRAAITKGDGRD